MSGPEQSLGRMPPDDDELAAFLAGKGAVRAAWQASQQASAPPAALDARILAAAESAVGAARAIPRPGSRIARWQWPLALAATVVLGMSLVFNALQTPELRVRASAPAAAPAVSEEEAAKAAADRGATLDQPSQPSAAPEAESSGPAPAGAAAALAQSALSVPKAAPAEKRRAEPTTAQEAMGVAMQSPAPAPVSPAAMTAQATPKSAVAVAPPPPPEQMAAAAPLAQAFSVEQADAAPARAANEQDSVAAAEAVRPAEMPRPSAMAARKMEADRPKHSAATNNAAAAAAAAAPEASGSLALQASGEPPSAPVPGKAKPAAAAASKARAALAESAERKDAIADARSDTADASSALRALAEHYAALEFAGAGLSASRWTQRLQPLLQAGSLYATGRPVLLCEPATVSVSDGHSARLLYRCAGRLLTAKGSWSLQEMQTEDRAVLLPVAGADGLRLANEPSAIHIGKSAAQAWIAEAVAAGSLRADQAAGLVDALRKLP